MAKRSRKASSSSGSALVSVTGSDVDSSRPRDLAGFTEVWDLGEGMTLYQAPLDGLREQDVNGRILPAGDHNTLVNNIRKRGKLESVPYCAWTQGRVEIVSGHHRIRAAREAGLSDTLVLVDESGLSRSEIVAKQLAHNRLQGVDDPETIKQLFAMLKTADDILASGLAGDVLEVPTVDLDPGLTPQLDMDMRVVTLTFLPHQLAALMQLIALIPPSELVGVASVDQYEPFMAAVVKYGRLKNIRNVGTALSQLVELALHEIQQADEVATIDMVPEAELKNP